MAERRSVERWVGDRLHDILGFSEDSAAQYTVALAARFLQQRRNIAGDRAAAELAQQLVRSEGFPDDAARVRAFADELVDQLRSADASTRPAVARSATNEPASAGGTGRTAVEARSEEQRKAALLRRNERFTLLEDDGVDSIDAARDEKREPTPTQKPDGGAESNAAARHRSSTKARRKRDEDEREAGAGGADSDGKEERERIRQTKQGRARRATVANGLAKGDEGGAEEKPDAAEGAEDALDERQRDLAERDAFAERLKQRDEGRRDGEKDGAENHAAASERQTESDIERLRELSRMAYLRKHEEKELELLRQKIEAETYLFGDVKVTERERRELAFNEEMYRLASERARLIRTEEEEHEGGRYHMPDDYYDAKSGVRNEKARMSVLTKRYRDDPAAEERGLLTDQQEWEEHLINKANSRGRLGEQPGGAIGGKEYELVMDDAVEFVREDVLLGDDEAEEAPPPEEVEAASIAEERKLLPIYPFRDRLIAAIQEYPVLVVVGETGSGKTTQLPQYLIEEGFGKVCCTQPRRVAAMSVAARVSTEMRVKLGWEVGYSIRFEDCTSERTKIKYMTDGMLLREFLSNPLLDEYHVIIIDEAHERSLSTDVVMGLVKDIGRARSEDLRIVVSSATLNAEKFSDFFDGAPRFNIPGRRYPVDIYYTRAPEADYLDACCVTALQIHSTQPRGDILMFLTGQEEIEAAEEILVQRTRGMGSKLGEMVIAPIYATLPSDQQAKIFEPTPPGARKVVLATNIAETSVTIPGIVYVIDPGFIKQKSYNAKTGMESLVVVPVSRAGATQRAGRAGRTQAGKSFRMFTKWSFYNEMEDDTVPEILRTNLAQVVLLLKSLRIDDLVHFEFLDAPPTDVLIKSLEQLYALGALNDRGELTKLGRRMAELPLDPMMAKALIASEKYMCSEEVATVCAMLSVNSAIFYRPKDKAVIADAERMAFARGGGGDHMALLNCYNQWRDSGFSTQWCYEHFVQARTIKQARDVRTQLDALLERVEVPRVSTMDTEHVRKAIASGFFYNAARLDRSGAYRTLKNPHSVHIHPSSCLHKTERLPRWVIYHELVLTTKEYMRQIIEIESAWLFEIAPYYYKKKEIEDLSKAKMPKMVGRASHTAQKA